MKHYFIKPIVILSGFLILAGIAYASNPLFYYSMAEVAMEQGEYATADSLLSIAYQIDPTSEEVIIEKLNALYYLRDEEKLISFGEEVLTTGMVLPEVYIMLAHSYKELGNISKAKEIIFEGIENSESSNHLYLELYHIALYEADGDKAMQYLHQAESNTDDIELLYKIAQEYSRLKDDPMLEMTLDRILMLEPDFIQGHQWLAEHYFNKKEFTKAIPHLGYSPKEDPELSILSIRQLLLSYYFLQRFDKVIEMRDYFPMESSDSVLNRIFFFAAFKTKEFPLTIEYGEYLLEQKDMIEPERLQELYEMMAIAEIQLKHYEKASHYFSMIEDERVLLNHLNIIPFIAEQSKDTKLLHRLLVFALEEKSDTLACTFTALLAYNYAKNDSFDLSKKYISEFEISPCIQNYPLVLISYAMLETGEPVDSVYTLLEQRPSKDISTPRWLGQYFAEHDKIDQADKYFTIAVEQDSANLDLYFTVAQFYNEISNREKEIATLEKALQFFPDNADLLNWLGYTLVEDNIRLEESRFMLEKALELSPDNIYIWDSLAWAYYKLGLYEDALKAMEKVLKAGVDDSVISYHLGMIYLKNGKDAAAKKYLKKSIELNNNDEAVDKAKTELELLQ